MIKFERFRFSNKKLLHFSNNIRTKVFVEEQNVDPEIEYEFEEEGNYYLLFYNEIPIATCRWRKTGKGIKLERFALLMEYRNIGLGSVLLSEVLKDVLPLKQKIYLHSQVNAINYYRRAGFAEIGEPFFEADIEHVLMEYNPT